MFNEKKEEMGLPVWQSPKYVESRAKAIEIIESKKYGLTEADFWILMNKTKTNKMAYTGLILSHNGCLKINDALEKKVNPNRFLVDKEGYNNSLVYTYVDDEVYEVGEVNKDNCKNAYMYAMAYKRCFDRVVLKKSKLAYAGIYSEVEADEFKQSNEEIDIDDLRKQLYPQEQTSIQLSPLQMDWIKNQKGYASIDEVTEEDKQWFVSELERSKKQC